MNDALTILAILGLLGAGLIGGVFFTFSNFVMRALERLPAAQGLAAMQSINVVVLNPLFLGTFIGTAVVSAAAVVLACLQWGRPGAVFYVVGGVLYVAGTFFVTAFGNVPLNNALVQVAPDAEGADAKWQRYLTQWTRWNHVRTVAALLAAVSFCVGRYPVGP